MYSQSGRETAVPGGLHIVSVGVRLLYQQAVRIVSGQVKTGYKIARNP